MKPDSHDASEALIQAPGEQILELGAEIDAFREALKTRADVSPALRKEIDERLAYFIARTREIEPVVEVLHEIADHLEVLKSDEDDELAEPTPFMARQQPPFAAVLLTRLATARTTSDAAKAADLRDLISIYARSSPILGVRDALVDGMRRDAYEHGETEPGYVISSVGDVRRQLLSCVPD